MVSIRDMVSSAIFYAGMIGLTAVLIHYGSKYGWEKVDEQFRSMEPRLTRGDHVWVNRHVRRPDQLQYLDIILRERPVRKRTSYNYEFARVIGKPGDVVKMEQHRIYRAERADDKLGRMEPITEHYVQLHQRPPDFAEFIVPRNTVFVMFDDRLSRDPLRDLIVPARAIVGKVLE
jgi:signal peptidase I